LRKIGYEIAGMLYADRQPDGRLPRSRTSAGTPEWVIAAGKRLTILNAII
jgi:hypothetical protein